MLRFTLAAILALSVSPALAHDPASPASANVLSVPEGAQPAVLAVDAFHAALDAGDRDAALALLTPDVIVLEEGGAERSREEYAGHHLPADMAFAGATHSDVARRTAVVEGHVAWVMTEGRTTGRFNDRAVDRLTAETMVLTRDADGWRIRHIHWSSRAPN